MSWGWPAMSLSLSLFSLSPLSALSLSLFSILSLSPSHFLSLSHLICLSLLLYSSLSLSCSLSLSLSLSLARSLSLSLSLLFSLFFSRYIFSCVSFTFQQPFQTEERQGFNKKERKKRLPKFSPSPPPPDLFLQGQQQHSSRTHIFSPGPAILHLTH